MKEKWEESDRIMFKCVNFTAPYWEAAPCSLGQESLKKKKRQSREITAFPLYKVYL